MNIFNKFKQMVGMRGGFIPKSLMGTITRRTRRRTKSKRRRTIKKSSK